MNPIRRVHALIFLIGLIFLMPYPGRAQDTTATAAPTGLRGTPDHQQISLTWSPNTEPDLSHYWVYRHTASDSLAASRLDSIPSPDTSYIDIGVVDDTAYYYWVSAVDSAGNESVLSQPFSGMSLLPGEYAADTNTVLLLHLNEAGGNQVFDASAAENDGTASGTTIVAGIFGSGRSFYADGDNINIPHSESLNFGSGSFTVDFWIKITDPNMYHDHPVEKGTGGTPHFGMQLLPSPHFGIADGSVVEGHSVSVSSSKSITDGRWHHVAGIRDGGTIKIYVNGILEGTADAPLVGSVDNTAGLEMRAGPAVLDELRISNIARTPEEFPMPQPPEDLVADAGDGEVLLSWNVSPSPDVQWYRIYHSATPPTFTLIDSVAAADTSCLDEDVTNETIQYYQVTAVNSIPLESGPTNVAYTMPLAPVPGEYAADNNTVLLLHLNEPSGPLVFDASAERNHGTTSGTTVVEGKFGNGRSYIDGGNISVPHNESLNFGAGSFTLEAWINTSGPINAEDLILKWSPDAPYYQLSISDGGVYFGIGDGSGFPGYSVGVSGPSILDGRWHHIAGVRDGAALRLYIDGILEGIADASLVGSIDNTAQVELIASTNILDEVRLSNVARTPEEFNIPLPPEGLIANSDNGHVRLTWSPSPTPDIVQVNIYRSMSMAADTLIDSVAVPQTTYIDTNVVSGTAYFYRLKAIDSNGFDSGFTPRVNITLGELFSRVASGPVATNYGSRSNGGAWGDFDNDGDLDLFVSNSFGGPNSLFINQGSGSFVKVTSGPVVSTYGESCAASWGDYDNDGDLDLFVANREDQDNELFTNNGDGTFTAITEGAIVSDGGASRCGIWADYDNDGDLDLFVSNYGQANFLYANNGDGTFTKVTAGSVVTDEEYSEGASWGDYDSDGDLDLFVANYWEHTSLYANNGDGTFTKITIDPAIPAERGGGSWGDFDNDGDLDLFVTNGAGQNNSLYTNNGDGSFSEVTSGPVVLNGGNSGGSAWGDYDNDGDLDLVVANYEMNDFLYLNDGDGTFTRITTDPIAAVNVAPSHGVSCGDMDNDGDLDIFIAVDAGGGFLYANNGNHNSWINILCVGTVSNRSAIGAKVRVRAATDGVNPVWQLREISAQTGFGGQNSLNAEFGLGLATSIDSIKVEWPTGIVQVLTDVAVNQFLTVVDPTLITDTQVITSDGPVDFPGTNISLDFTFTSQTGTDTVEVSEYQLPPPGAYPDTIGVLRPSYWIIDHRGAGEFSVDMTLPVEPGTFNWEDRLIPANIKLLHRGSIAEPWTIAAVADSATDTTVTFCNLTGFSYFTIGSTSIAGLAPSTVTDTATGVTDVSALLRGTIEPNGASTVSWFEWGTTTAYGSFTDSLYILSATSSTGFDRSLTDLTPGATYHFRVVAENVTGMTYGGDQIFTTLAAPTVTADSTGSITETTAILYATIDPHSLETAVSFDYGTTTDYGTNRTANPSPVSGNDPVQVSASLAGLTAGTEYHYRVVATNSIGTTRGEDLVYTTTPLDVAGPTITDVNISANPSAQQPITIQASVSDPKGVRSVDLLYLKGGTAGYMTVPMSPEGGDAYSGTISGTDVTVSGLAFFLHAQDELVNVTRSDTLSIPIAFPEDALTSNIPGSAFLSGFPKTRWRLFSLPGDLDQNSLSATIQDELGGPPSNQTWKVYRYTGSASQPYVQPTSFTPGECNWLIQAIEEDIDFGLGSGSSFDLAGFSLTLQARRWHFISSPYAFALTVNVDQGIFYGPFTYGSYGSEGQEGWSLSTVQTTFKPWGGYIVYNNTDEIQSLEIKPPGLAKAILAKSEDHSLEEGWLLHLTVEGDRYFDGGSAIGRVQNALEGRDDYDHPEPPWLEGYVSLTMEHPEWGNDQPQYTSDIRSSEEVNGVWDMDISTKGESGPIKLTSGFEGKAPADFQVVLLDVVTRQLHDPLDENSPVIITDYREEFPYHLKAVAGSQAWVDATVQEILAQLPEEFALSQNYPNPFNPSTTIEYALPKPARVSLRIYSLLGQETATLVNDWQDMGYHNIVWDGRDEAGRNAATGVYFTVLHADGHVLTSKMLLLK